MANILGNVFKGKDGVSGGLAAQGAGQGSSVRPANPNIRTSGRTYHSCNVQFHRRTARQRAC